MLLSGKNRFIYLSILFLSFFIFPGISIFFFGCYASEEKPVPTQAQEKMSLTHQEEKEISDFVAGWKRAYENCDPELADYYIKDKESFNKLEKYSMDQLPLKIEIVNREFEKKSDSFVVVELGVEVFIEKTPKKGIVTLEIQKSGYSSWKIYDMKIDPEDLLINKKKIEEINTVPAEKPVKTPDKGPTEKPIKTPDSEATEKPDEIPFSYDEVTKPEIIQRFLPYEEWTEEYEEYFQRHYHDPSLKLVPGAIVMHYTVTESLEDTLDIFIKGREYDDGDVGLIFGHLSVHYIIDKDGTIYQILPLDVKCRGAYGVNHIAISIEMVAMDEEALMNQSKTLESSFKLVRYLMLKFNIPIEKVWGHYDVSEGKSRIPEYTDYGDKRSPDSYPEGFMRSDPGKAYMEKLKEYLKENN